MEALLAKLTDRLPSILTPQCFKTTTAHIRSPLPASKVSEEKQSQKDPLWACQICTKYIDRVPFYLNANSKAICNICEEEANDSLLVKVRSPQMLNKLSAVTMMPSFRADEQEQGSRAECPFGLGVHGNSSFNCY